QSSRSSPRCPDEPCSVSDIAAGPQGRVLPSHGVRRLHPPRGRPVRPERFTVLAPATTANLGPGFDCAGAGLALWTELHVGPADFGTPLVTLEGEGVDELPADESHLGLQAFGRVLPVKRFSFRFVNRIPLDRGLGSSAATVAAGVVAGLIAAGRDASLDEV